MGRKGSTVDGRIATIASRSHGVVTRSELLAAGLSARAVDRRIKRGALIPVHRGVFRVGHQAPSIEAIYIAAVKACGDGAVLAGSAAAYLWRLRRHKPPQIEVIAPRYRRRAHIVLRRDRLGPHEATLCRGVPVTSVARTVVDLARFLAESELARAFHEAAVRHHTNPEQVEAILARRHNWPGARTLRRVVWGDAAVTVGRLEARFLALVKATRLPQPGMNRRVDGRHVDRRWPEHKLTVELDGYRYHKTRHAWEQDRQREREARARGDEFRRYTWRDVAEDPAPMLRDLRRLLVRPTLL
jgi:very-short-patch-repair endonuclease